MRRNDREITDETAVDAFIQSEKIIRIAFYDEGDIYIVPVNYGYERSGSRRFFYFHGAKAGRKYQLAQHSPVVGFEIDGRFRVIEGENACDFSANFQSVTGTGTLTLIEDNTDKAAALNCLMKHMTNRNDFSYSDKSLSGTAVFRLEVSKISCKAK